MTEPVLFSWSGGKDSALALYELQRQGQYRVDALLTTLSEAYDRISHHGVRRDLLEQQARAIGLPLAQVFLPLNVPNEVYETKMRDVLLKYKERGVESVVFGDIFLEDLRRYREERLAQVGMNGVFPLWKQDTTSLVHRFLDLGFKAVLVCIDPKRMDPSFAGRRIDEQFLLDLPAAVDPCGENGEFHSFVYDGPIFKEQVEYRVGEVVLRDTGNYYCDLLPA